MPSETVPDIRVSKKDETNYFKEASSWDDDRVATLMRSIRQLRLFAISGVAIALIEAIGLAALIPFHTVEPFLVRVDTSTGIVDQVVKLKDARESYDEVMTKFFLRRVVSLRETYTRGQLQSNYDQSVLFTAPAARPCSRPTFLLKIPTVPTSAMASWAQRQSRSSTYPLSPKTLRKFDTNVRNAKVVPKC